MRRKIRLSESQLISVIKRAAKEHTLVSEATEMEQQALSAWNSESDSYRMGFLKALVECLGERHKTIDKNGNIVEKGKHGWRLLRDIGLVLGSFGLSIYMALKQTGALNDGPGNPLAGLGVMGSIGLYVKGIQMTVQEITEISRCVKEKMGKTTKPIDFKSVMPKTTSDNTNVAEPIGESKKIVRLTESELIKLVKNVVREQKEENIIGNKIEHVVEKPKVQNHIEDIISNCSERDLEDLKFLLDDLGIDENSTAKEVHDIVSEYENQEVDSEMTESGEENPKQKVAKILHDIGAGNIAAWGGVPAAIAIGSMTGMPVGFAISWGVTGLLMGIAKVLSKKDNE